MDASLASQPFCYLTTKGRKSGKPRTVELWFAGEGDMAYMVSGGGLEANWVRNLMRDPAVSLRVGDVEFRGTARVVDRAKDPEAWRRGAELCSRKYYKRDASYLQRGWSREAVVVEVKLQRSPAEP